MSTNLTSKQIRMRNLGLRFEHLLERLRNEELTPEELQVVEDEMDRIDAKISELAED